MQEGLIDDRTANAWLCGKRRSKTLTMKRTGYRAPEIAHETAGVH
jgi:hypothetical protein